MTARTATPTSLDSGSDDNDDRRFDIADPHADTEKEFQARETEALLDRALAELPVEDATIARLKYGEGLSLKQIRDALHLDALTEDRVRRILERLKTVLAKLSSGASVRAIVSEGVRQ
jgi:RNA polymerase sigma factor (sigma-70 family)